MATKLVIVGGVAGGATAAARARRLDEFAEIIVFERGEHISFANCGLPYYIGQVIKKRDRLLVTTAEALRARPTSASTATACGSSPGAPAATRTPASRSTTSSSWSSGSPRTGERKW